MDDYVTTGCGVGNDDYFCFGGEFNVDDFPDVCAMDNLGMVS